VVLPAPGVDGYVTWLERAVKPGDRSVGAGQWEQTSVLVQLERTEAALASELDRLRAAIRGVRAVLAAEPVGPGGDAALLTVEQATRELHASRSRVFQLLAAGELDGVRVGRARCVTRRSIDDLLGRLGAA